jgi:hypothetical protein
LTADGMSCPPCWREHLTIRARVVLLRAARRIALSRREDWLLFVGDDWAEEHHDVELQDEAGRRLGKAKFGEGIAGIARLHELRARR